jgi:hypothetical protein
MARVALRSPNYKSLTAGANSVYAICTIKIGGVLKYTLRKEVAPQEVVLFEISELCRDFLNITFDGTYTAQTLTIETEINSYNSAGGITASTQPINDIGYDAYSTFMDGANAEVPYSRPNILMSRRRNPHSYAQADIYVPVGYAGVVPGVKIDETMEYYSYGATDETIQGTTMGIQVNIHRIDCTKYGDGHKITFVNKFGALQDLWFYLKEVNTTSKKQEQFQRNIITPTGTYSVNQHTKQDYNTVANTSVTLSSGYYPEWCNAWFEQLLLSEQVWLTRPVYWTINNDEVVPLNVRKSSMVKKTSVNDKLIEYTFEFDMSFDYINNVR